MGLFGDRELRKLGKEASVFRKLVEKQVGDGSSDSSNAISGEDLARMVAGAVRDRLQELGEKGKGPKALDCLRNAFQGAGPDVRAKADEFLGASEPLLSESADR